MALAEAQKPESSDPIASGGDGLAQPDAQIAYYLKKHHGQLTAGEIEAGLTRFADHVTCENPRFAQYIPALRDHFVANLASQKRLVQPELIPSTRGEEIVPTPRLGLLAHARALLFGPSR